MAEPDVVADYQMKAPECGSLCQIYRRVATAVGIPGAGGPTMANAQPNLNQEAADEMRRRAEAGTAPINVAGMNQTAANVRRRDQMLREL